MENKKSNEAMSVKDGKQSNGATSNASSMKHSQLMQLFEDGLADIYWAEKALTKALPKMIKKATSQELIAALKSHHTETENHVVRLEEVFASMGKKTTAIKCEAMDGLITEAGEIMDKCETGSMRDAGIIAAAQKVEHYEIATYGTLRQFAETLGMKEAAALLEATLIEEKAADVKLTEVAVSSVNVEASEEIA